MWWVVGVAVAAVLLSAYLWWTAHRVERVHVRVQSAGRALDAHLLRRAAAAAVVAENTDVGELYAAARLALDAESAERETAENDLTRQLQAIPLTGADPATQTLIATSRRAVIARQVHTDLVRDALTSRRRPVVRLLRLARHYERPRYFDIVEPLTPELSAGATGVPAGTDGSAGPVPAKPPVPVEAA